MRYDLFRIFKQAKITTCDGKIEFFVLFCVPFYSLQWFILLYQHVLFFLWNSGMHCFFYKGSSFSPYFWNKKINIVTLGDIFKFFLFLNHCIRWIYCRSTSLLQARNVTLLLVWLQISPFYRNRTVQCANANKGRTNKSLLEPSAK